MTHYLSILFNAAFVPVTWLAVNGNTAAGNAVKFISGATIACSIILLASVAFTGYVSKLSDRPLWYRRSTIAIDIVITAMLACSGWFWCASAMVVGILATMVFFASGDGKDGAK